MGNAGESHSDKNASLDRRQVRVANRLIANTMHAPPGAGARPSGHERSDVSIRLNQYVKGMIGDCATQHPVYELEVHVLWQRRIHWSPTVQKKSATPRGCAEVPPKEEDLEECA
jgi:hypothetical protein